MFPLGEFAVYCRFPDVVGVTQALYIGAGWKPPGSFCGKLGVAWLSAVIRSSAPTFETTDLRAYTHP